MSSTPRTMSTSSTSSASSRYSRFGIGGAGNYQLLESFSNLPCRPIACRTTGPFRTGIGGAGNVRSFEERAATMSEQEESYKRSLQYKSVPSKRHYGIGGAGNAMRRSSSSSSSSADSVASLSSHMSGADRLMGRISGMFN